MEHTSPLRRRFQRTERRLKWLDVEAFDSKVPRKGLRLSTVLTADYPSVETRSIDRGPKSGCPTGVRPWEATFLIHGHWMLLVFVT